MKLSGGALARFGETCVAPLVAGIVGRDLSGAGKSFRHSTV